MAEGTLALVGGREWTEGCGFDAALLKESGGDVVTVLSTAAAYENPQKYVDRARTYFKALDAEVVSVPLFSRHDTAESEFIDSIRNAQFLYLSDGSPMHLRSVLRETPAYDALQAAWRHGAVIAASGASAMALCEPMVDPRGGAFTIGLGLVNKVGVIPHHNTWTAERVQRTMTLAPSELTLLVIDEATAVIRRSGTWSAEGAGQAVAHRDGHPVPLTELRI